MGEAAMEEVAAVVMEAVVAAGVMVMAEAVVVVDLDTMDKSVRMGRIFLYLSFKIQKK